MIIVLIIIAAASVLSFAKLYLVWEEIHSPQALWHDDECYIIVGVETYGWAGSYLAAGREFFIELLGIPPDPLKLKAVRHDVLVYHYTNGMLKRYPVQNFAIGGRFFPHKGILHYGEGTAQGSVPPVWRWSGSEFLRLTDQEALQVRAAYTGDTERLRAEGWSRYDYQLDFQKPERSLPIKLSGYELILILKSDQHMTRKALVLSGPGIKEPEEILAASDGSRKIVDKQTYMEVTKSGVNQ